MTAQLVLLDGRGQRDERADERKAASLAALADGANGRALPISESDVFLPAYDGSRVHNATDHGPADVAETIVRGQDAGAAERVFVRSVLTDMLAGVGVTEDVIRAAVPPRVVERGPLSWEWVYGGLSLIDRFVPGASGTMVAAVTHDVARYLLSPRVRRRTDQEIARAFASCRPGGDVVVVAHSVGSVVAYNLLRNEGPRLTFRVPLLVTLGSPLGVDAIRKLLEPLSHPTAVRRWFNAFDIRDVVALHPLDRRRFGITPPIDNYDGVRNDGLNHHGFADYLRDPRVAGAIHDALG